MMKFIWVIPILTPAGGGKLLYTAQNISDMLV